MTNGSLDLAAGTSLAGKQILATVPCTENRKMGWGRMGVRRLRLLLDAIKTVYFVGMTAMTTMPILAVAQDGDCDGTVTADDCNDNDHSTTLATDGDCDGFDRR